MRNFFFMPTTIFEESYFVCEKQLITIFQIGKI